MQQVTRACKALTLHANDEPLLKWSPHINILHQFCNDSAFCLVCHSALPRQVPRSIF